MKSTSTSIVLLLVVLLLGIVNAAEPSLRNKNRKLSGKGKGKGSDSDGKGKGKGKGGECEVKESADPGDMYLGIENYEFDEECMACSTKVVEGRWAGTLGGAGTWLDLQFTVYQNSTGGISGSGLYLYEGTNPDRVWEMTDITDYCNLPDDNTITVWGPMVASQGQSFDYLVLTISETSPGIFSPRALASNSVTEAENNFASQCQSGTTTGAQATYGVLNVEEPCNPVPMEV